MQGITFLGFHSYQKWGLLLESKEIGSPPVKEEEIEIPGGNGRLDATEAHGEVKYDNVKHKFTFLSLAPYNDHLPLFTAIKNAIHGKKGRIILDGDPAFYYVGRCHVSSLTNDRGAGFVTVECNCEPYKYKMERTVVTKAVNGMETIILTNGRKRAVPEVRIETESSLNIVYQNDFVWALGSGSFTLPELELVEGENIVTVTGTGTITFEWQEGYL